jgi:hypothetical protein
VIDIDEIEADRLLAKLHLAGSGIAKVDLLPLEDFGPTGFMNSNGVRHGALQRASTAKEKPHLG